VAEFVSPTLESAHWPRLGVAAVAVSVRCLRRQAAVASFGFRYDYTLQLLQPADPIPGWLLPLIEKVEAYGGRRRKLRRFSAPNMMWASGSAGTATSRISTGSSAFCLERPASSASGVRMVKSGKATRSRPRRAPRCLAKGEESQGLQDDLAMSLFVYVNTSKQVGDLITSRYLPTRMSRKRGCGERPRRRRL
jgi:hypothetical protein